MEWLIIAVAAVFVAAITAVASASLAVLIRCWTRSSG